MLPLQNLSNDPQQDYFADGMTDDLITELAQVGNLRVISRTSAMRYKNTNKTLPQIARELNVDAVLEGSVLRAGDRVRVTAQLIQADSDRHLWAQSYERDLRNVLVLQDEIARGIVGQVRANLRAHGNARQVNPEAYEAYLRGRHDFNTATSEAHLESSISKAGVGGSTPSLATIILNNLAAQSRNFQPTIQPTIRRSNPRFLTEPSL